MSNNYNKNFVHQVMTLEMDRLILKKTNEKIAQKKEMDEEASKKYAQEILEQTNQQLKEAQQEIQTRQRLYEQAKEYQPHGLLADIFWTLFCDVIPSLLIILFWIAIGFSIGYWLIGQWFLALGGVDIEIKTQIILGAILGSIGLRIGLYFVTESFCSVTEIIPLSFVMLFWTALGGILGYWLIGQWILVTICHIAVGIIPKIILGIILGVVGFCIGRDRCENVYMFSPDLSFTTKEEDIAYAKTNLYRRKNEYETSVKKYEALEKQKAELLSYSPPPCSIKLQKQIELNQKNIEYISEILDKYYALNIIPPDYRKMDCIITLDHIFQNDLADTMREAVLLYKNWLFQGMIIEGMEKIYSMMGNLSAQMQYMQTTLDNIESNTASFYNDLTDLFEKQGRTQEKLLEESKCTRYAAESIKRSNEKYEWYIEQHRQGLL